MNPSHTPDGAHRPTLLATCALGALAVIYVVLALIGAVHSYTPVPLTDMWDGTVDFYRRVSQGETGIWITGHNEHRIVLARALFWLDLRLFGGRAWFLITVNYLLILAGALLVWKLLRVALPRAQHDAMRVGTMLFLIAWMFSWCQEGNLTWGFQSQFILAQLLPLAALFALCNAGTQAGSGTTWFMAATALGVASLGTMANGVLTLPILAIYAIITRQGWRRVLVLAVLAVLLGAAYQRGLSTSPGPSKLELLSQKPYECLRFLLLYLGSPFYYIARHLTHDARHVSAVMGAVMIVGALFAAIHELRQPQPRRLQWALVMFLVYIGGTAAGTTLGRAATGEIQALSSRYTTPAVMAWAVLTIWLVSVLVTRSRRWQCGGLLAMATLLSVGLVEQRHAIDDQNDKHFDQSLAALAMGMGVADDDQIRFIYPFTQTAIQLAHNAADANLSIFSKAPWKGTDAIIGSFAGTLPQTLCRGNVDETRQASTQTRFVRIRGWLHGPSPETEGGAVRVIQDGKVIGYGLIGRSRPDVVAVAGKSAALSGFEAYVLSDHVTRPLVLAGAGCQLQTALPVMLYRETTESPATGARIITTSALLPGNEWLGKDFHGSTFDGMTVLASLVRADADKGTIRFTAHRGDSFFYRSGPTSGRQHIQLDGSKAGAGVLPLAEKDWVKLTLDAPTLPDSFVVTLLDDGDGWGEWSAIAIASASAQSSPSSPH